LFTSSYLRKFPGLVEFGREGYLVAGTMNLLWTNGGGIAPKDDLGKDLYLSSRGNLRRTREFSDVSLDYDVLGQED
jgi:hypothetical protein